MESLTVDRVLDAMSCHELTEIAVDDHVKVYKMANPDSWVHGLVLTFHEFPFQRIVLWGDLVLGRRRKGIISDNGYSLGWFLRLSNGDGGRYMAEKFLEMSFSVERAIELLSVHAEWLKTEGRGVEARFFEDVHRRAAKGNLGDMTGGEFRDYVDGLAPMTDDKEYDLICDEIEDFFEMYAGGGMIDYNPSELSVLCGVQEKFQQLYRRDYGIDEEDA